ncbi:DUF1206 domain-containing protein [Modestobacter roseus]|uniref:Uncharacterized protein DUF1206 n=1 Tax=Modestobacter roseus TaxID=1181884 RepID=A0A562IRR3_9ACTN|nr:DUF1206 domain-containing protein [Modestobacter roseus]MQA32655.1 DUF1206 domain-containing protein [Modestobacter roseus]TWH73701.1 uncharacterized protein DUF1206 [Modestobacter roseus]
MGTGQAAHDAAASTTLRRFAAVGLVGYGLLHLAVAWLALQLAWRETGTTGTGGNRGPGRETTADPSGALSVLAGSPSGTVALWVLVAGLAGLALWQAAEVLRHHRSVPPPGRARWSALARMVRTVATAAVYGYLAVLAARATVTGGQQRDEEQSAVRGVLGWPGGQLLVVAVAVVVAGVGAHLAQKGVRAAFGDELDLAPFSPRLRRLIQVLCQAGFVTKGVALLLVGGVVGWAAATFDPEQANGLDGALRTIADAPYGRWLLSAIAAGTALFSVYCFARARHPVG